MEGPSLCRLHASENQLTRVPDCVFALRHLDTLDVSRNAITELPAEMWYARSLHNLNASYNQIKELPVDTKTICRQRLGTLVRSMGSESDTSKQTSETTSPSQSTGPSSENERSGHPRSAGSTSMPDGFPTFPGEDTRRSGARTNSSNGTSGIGSMDQQESERSGGSSHGSSTDRHSESFLSQSRRRQRQSTVGTFFYGMMDSDEDEDQDDDDEEGAAIRSSKHHQSLKTLELVDNQLTSLPEALPCLAPELTKLNVAGNKIEKLCFPRGFPPFLRQMDLSRNQLKAVEASHDFMPYICPRRGQRLTQSMQQHTQVSPCKHRRHNVLHKLSTLTVSYIDAVSVSGNTDSTIMANFLASQKGLLQGGQLFLQNAVI